MNKDDLAKAVDDLLSVLKAQNEILKQLIELGEREKEILTHNRWSELLEITSQENKLVEDLRRIEKQGNNVYSLLSTELDLDDDTSLNDLLRMRQIPSKGELTLIRGLLKLNAEKLKELNELNFILLQKSLIYFKKMENMIFTNNNYTNEGSLEEIKGSSSFNKIV